jgi:hypothetical protein
MKILESNEFVHKYIQQINEVAVRVSIILQNKGNNDLLLSAQGKVTKDEEEKMISLREISGELLALVEQKVGSSIFIEAYSSIQSRMQSKKMERKREILSEAVNNPKLFAMRKVILNLDYD